MLAGQDGRLLATGSRDRYLMLLDLTKYDSSRPETKKEMKLHCLNKAHNVSVGVKAVIIITATNNCICVAGWSWLKISSWGIRSISA